MAGPMEPGTGAEAAAPATPGPEAGAEAVATPAAAETRWHDHITWESARNVGLVAVGLWTFNFTHDTLGSIGDANEGADQRNTLVDAVLANDDAEALEQAARDVLGLETEDMARATERFQGISILQPTDEDANGDGVVDRNDYIEIYTGDGQQVEVVSLLNEESIRSAVEGQKSDFTSRLDFGWKRWFLRLPASLAASAAATIGAYWAGRRVRRELPEDISFPGIGGGEE